MILFSYDFPKSLYETGIPFPEEGPGFLKLHQRKRHWSAAYLLGQIGFMIWYGDHQSHTGRKAKVPMQDIDGFIQKWKEVIVGLATAHDKDGADRMEAQVNECLTPVLTMPVKQLREFAPKLAEALENDPRVPFLVHRAYRVWVDQMKSAPDEDVIELKTAIARDIVTLVEDDAKAQLPDAMIRALQWRSPEKLEQVKQVIEREKAEGRSVRLRGRESCLFLEAGGTEETPEVCVQI